MTCSRLKTIFTLSTNIAMGELSRACFENSKLSKKKRLSLSSNSFFRLSKFSINTTSCTEILSLIIYSSTTVLWKWEISDFAKVCKRLRWPKQCWALQFTWRHRFWMGKFIQIKQIFGQSGLFFTKCCMVIAPSNLIPFPNSSKFLKRLSCSSPIKLQSLTKLKSY